MKTHLVFACLTVFLLAFVIGRSRQKPVKFEDIVAQAQALARKDYAPPRKEIPKILRDLNYDQFRDIRWKEAQTLWRRLGLPFQVKFFFAGGPQSASVNLFQVNRDSAKPLLFSEDYFDFGKNVLSQADRQAGGYSGFRVHYPINRPDYLDEFIVYLGASYFRGVGKEQLYGLSARGIAVDCASETKAEEFPSFTSFWLVQPGNTDQRMKIYALLDGPSVSGAYEFVVEPGVTTRVDVKASLFFRKKVASLGLAPLTSMFWYGENTSNTFGDLRPEVHDSDGLLVRGKNEEWLWRPLSWSKNLQHNVFTADSPRGFGLLQRDREFTHYQDLEANYHRRPSAWVEPHGEWGKGEIQLIQFPTNNEFMDNAVAFWQPAVAPEAGDKRELSYSLFWQGQDPLPPQLAKCVTTRIDFQDEKAGKGQPKDARDASDQNSQPWYRVFVLDFASDEIAKLPPDAPLRADVSAGPGGEVNPVRIEKNQNDNTWRATFTVSTKTLKKPFELRCLLRQQDGRAVSETWNYTWNPQ